MDGVPTNTLHPDENHFILITGITNDPRTVRGNAVATRPVDLLYNFMDPTLGNGKFDSAFLPFYLTNNKDHPLARDSGGGYLIYYQPQTSGNGNGPVDMDFGNRRPNR